VLSGSIGSGLPALHNGFTFLIIKLRFLGRAGDAGGAALNHGGDIVKISGPDFLLLEDAVFLSARFRF